MQSTRARQVAAGAVAVTAVLMAGLMTSPAQADNGPGAVTGAASTATIGDCTPEPLIATRYVGADGNAVSPQAFAVKSYLLADGNTMSTTIPPALFRPQTASVSTARAFGFDAPTDPAALKAWRARYAGYQQTIESIPCTVKDGPRWGTSYSSNWSGTVATGHIYNEVYDDQNIPTYSAACGSSTSSLVGHWIGEGGYTGGGLVQQGFSPPATVSNGSRMWFEYLNANGGIAPDYIGTDDHTGNVISMYMTFDGNTAVFHWYDRTAGSGWSPTTVSGLSAYADRSTAEFISERPNGYNLRHFSTESFTAAGAKYGSTYVDLGNLPHDNTILTSNGASSGHKLITNGALGQTAFSQTWNACS
jgi:hypothetical protein